MVVTTQPTDTTQMQVCPIGALAPLTVTPPRSDSGGVSLSAVLLLPLVLVLCTAGLQAVLWNHTSAVSRAVVRHELLRVAHGVESPDDARRAVIERLGANTDLNDVMVEIVVTPRGADGIETSLGGATTRGAAVVTMRVSGSVMGIIPVTRAPVEIVESLPVEGWRPWP